MSSAARRSEQLARARRAQRYRRRDLVWEVGDVQRTKQCGRKFSGHAFTPGENRVVKVVAGPHGAGYRGLAYCGSLHSCPVCSAVIRTKRAAEIMLAVDRHLAAGGSILFVTFKVPHIRRDSLESVLNRLRGGFHAFKRNRAGRELLARIGHVAHVSALEVTHGRNGWHPHLHCLFFVAGKVGADSLDAWAGEVQAEWSGIAERRGWPVPRRDREGVHQGVDVQLVRSARDAAGYVAKVQGEDGLEHSPALELTRGDLKQGRRVKQLTPFEILDGYAAAVAEKGARAGRRWVGMWREYEETMRGRRCIVWSKDARRAFGLGDEQTDEQLAEEVRHDDADVIATVDRAAWRVIVCQRQRHKLLDAAEAGGAAGVALFIEQALARWEASEHREPPPD